MNSLREKRGMSPKNLGGVVVWRVFAKKKEGSLLGSVFFWV
jgi:hypothetical protein